jgi:nucleoside 2-deoxyribosyltransferase
MLAHWETEAAALSLEGTDVNQPCPVCLGAHGATVVVSPTPRDAKRFACSTCGTFELTETAGVNLKSPRTPVTPVQRSALSHHLRSAGRETTPVVNSDWLDRFLTEARLPSMEQQAANLVRLVGDHLRAHGDGLPLESPAVATQVGAFNPSRFGELRDELVAEGILKLISQGMGMITGTASFHSPATYGLTLRGWTRYETELQGKFAARYGFIALKFGDDVLETLVADCIKPVVLREIGYPVVDMRNVARAGVIDNILREQIRDAAFVLVDLTHDNSGAYWEAGYAEGLGKPVIYLCERSKFDRAKTHFDTNHCTTVMWDPSGGAQFEAELVATLRRSLNLFESADGSSAAASVWRSQRDG